MNKFYLFISATVLVLSTGCTSTTALNHFERDPLSANAIQYTKKADLLYKTEIKAMVFVTYLNDVDKKYESNKINSFLIGVHLVNKENNNSKSNDYTITLNGHESENITALDKDSKLVKSIPLKNIWADYYLINFKNDDSQSLKIEFTHSLYGQTQLTFQK